MTDPYRHLKDFGWREIDAIDARLAAGEIDDAGWHRAMADLVVPAYLAADTPWGQSGKSGDAAGWEYSRSLLADGMDRPGTLLDVGCASGWMMECIPRWTDGQVEPYGVDIAPELADLARGRLPHWADRIWCGNALSWEPPHRFTYVRTGLEYVPAHRRQDLVLHLLGHCERLLVGVFNEQTGERPTEESIGSWGLSIGGRTERVHRTKPGMSYRVLWIDA